MRPSSARSRLWRSAGSRASVEDKEMAYLRLNGRAIHALFRIGFSRIPCVFLRRPYKSRRRRIGSDFTRQAACSMHGGAMGHGSGLLAFCSPDLPFSVVRPDRCSSARRSPANHVVVATWPGIIAANVPTMDRSSSRRLRSRRPRAGAAALTRRTAFLQPIAPIPTQAPASTLPPPLPPPLPSTIPAIGAIPAAPGSTNLLIQDAPTSTRRPTSLSGPNAGRVPVRAWVNGRPIFDDGSANVDVEDDGGSAGDPSAEPRGSFSKHSVEGLHQHHRHGSRLSRPRPQAGEVGTRRPS